MWCIFQRQIVFVSFRGCQLGCLLDTTHPTPTWNKSMDKIFFRNNIITVFITQTPWFEKVSCSADGKRWNQIQLARSCPAPPHHYNYNGVQFAPICYKAKPPLTVISSNHFVCLLCIFYFVQHSLYSTTYHISIDQSIFLLQFCFIYFGPESANRLLCLGMIPNFLDVSDFLTVVSSCRRGYVDLIWFMGTGTLGLLGHPQIYSIPVRLMYSCFCPIPLCLNRSPSKSVAMSI